MTAEERNMKREKKKQEIIGIMLKYKDEFGNIDLSRLRKEDSKTYNKITYYFGSIDEALAESGFQSSKDGSQVANGAPLNRKTLRNELAYDMLVQLRKEHTLEEIAQKYDCTRAHVNQLLQSLRMSVGAIREVEDDNLAE